ncbi:ferric reductase family protein [Aspergillus candidus]|uniref:Ferric reductase n=1 Tax=Aspergillus candidus TaxID=41067 RepID=A0A2I2FIP9_ASPCN|nr:ferric reductase [Aspergillus candidus]PLB40507.1 ferric reductase [Aspergillus candidus]
MAMSEHTGSGLPWLDQPVRLHSSRHDTCKLRPDQCAYRAGRWRYWYEADHVYALSTIYFLCATVGVFAVGHLLSKYAPDRLRRTGLWRRATLVARYLSYKCFRLRLPAVAYSSPSLGVLLLGIVGVAFFFAMTLGPQPYYWPKLESGSYGSSPPIATRSGWMALGLLPFVLALGTKANLISALTGVSHEKLQVFHHWTSYAMFVLALVHTFPYIIYHIDKGDMVKKWDTDIVYWTGVAAIIPQAYLTFMSIPAIRNRYYEFFKATHFLAAILFVVFFFFHCDFRLSSWDYFIAAGAIYLTSLCASLAKTHFTNGRHAAHMELLRCGLVRVRIPTTTMSWHPGQHIFIRFLNPRLGLHCLTAHPFTICTLSHTAEKLGHSPEIIFYIKPRRGITGRMARLAAKNPNSSSTVLLEGPYGGIFHAGALNHFDNILVIAGGSGGGFSLGVVEEALRAHTSPHTGDSSHHHNQHIHVILATRSREMATWFRQEFEQRVVSHTADMSGKHLTISIYITADSQVELKAGSDKHLVLDPNENPAIGAQDKEPDNTPQKDTTTLEQTPNTSPSLSQQDYLADNDDDDDDLPHMTTTLIYGRPILKGILSDESSAIAAPKTDHTTGGSSGKRKVGVFVCGPASMVHDVRDAAADAQARILREDSAVGEVYLHTEPFA